ncbi:MULTISPECIES: prenyltransferase [Aliiglaciecola]|uniref:prenyltransferase n=1 Tax=Aliiglaciecola TaxID=1406885 RepID=UPI001C08A8F0|nr:MULTISPECIES: prenyltransferase [Aliiglaciecola]MBU2879627.1 prenyltransferase [Aliiglaciecola lipolytica]MDO6710094.1 prenyltransferase [Aliiglaciecola sp. 2_MG-2023]MDO6751242.1 prenyltransferase [Aliiglaciecola sp. 1_MG-2023]
MSQAIWIQALRTVPQVDKTCWDGLNILTKWLVASRFSVTIMSFTSAIIGILLALSTATVDFGLAVLCIIGLVLAHATNNLLNDYTDSARGVDKGNYFRTQYGTHVLESGLLTKKQLMGYISVTGALALACGFVIIYLRGIDVLWLLLAGAFFVLFYTWPLKKLALGELSVLIVWGPLMVGGSYYVSSGQWSVAAMLIGTLYALAPTAVIFGKHIDKMDMDKSKGIYSLPVLLGSTYARKAVQFMLLSQYFLAAYIYLSGYIGISILVLLLAVPTLIHTFKVFNHERPTSMPDGFRKEVWPLWFAPNAFQYTRKFSLFFLVMLILENIIAGFNL